MASKCCLCEFVALSELNLEEHIDTDHKNIFRDQATNPQVKLNNFVTIIFKNFQNLNNYFSYLTSSTYKKCPTTEFL